MSEIYNELYYKTNNYEDYLNKSERYNKLAFELIDFFNMLKIDYKNKNFLDYGCALGFFLNGLKNSGIDNTFGYDISTWALQQIDKDKHKIVSFNEIFNFNFEISFFFDVFEHMTDNQIAKVLEKIKSEKIIFRIPVCINSGEDFYLDISKKDKTHINCKTKTEWIEMFSKYGFKNLIKINLNNIYDSDGVFCGLIYKEKLYE